jgi:hypothetical protein
MIIGISISNAGIKGVGKESNGSGKSTGEVSLLPEQGLENYLPETNRSNTGMCQVKKRKRTR